MIFYNEDTKYQFVFSTDAIKKPQLDPKLEPEPELEPEVEVEIEVEIKVEEGADEETEEDPPPKVLNHVDSYVHLKISELRSLPLIFSLDSLRMVLPSCSMHSYCLQYYHILSSLLLSFSIPSSPSLMLPYFLLSNPLISISILLSHFRPCSHISS